MLPTPVNYEIYPAVVPTDKPTEMTVAPAEKAFIFPDGTPYRLIIIPIDGDEPDYQFPIAREVVDVTAEGGVLRFTHTFRGEQEFLIQMEYAEKKVTEFYVYALAEDLYKLRPLRGDFHSHSFRSDGKRDPAALAGHYREQGYDFDALTDHNRYYPGGEIDETYAGVKMGFTRVYGEEIHAPTSTVHIVHVGGKQSVAAKYVHEREAYEAEVTEYETRVPAEIPESYRYRYARAMWAADKIHEAGGLAIFAHPYWRPSGRVHNVRDEFAQILLKSGMFDAYELIGGMGQVGNNRSVAMWAELRAEGVTIPVVGSSDVHGIEKAGTFPHYFTICFAEANENDAIIGAVRAGNCTAVEAVGDEYARQYRCYGSLRLVSYAQFLLKTYFPRRQRICQGEGTAMRAYAMEDAPAELIELLAEQSARFEDRFFGRVPAPVPSASAIAFEEKWRAVQLNGPITKGSKIDAAKPNFQI